MKLRSFWHFGRLTYFLLDYGLLWLAVICAFQLSPRLQLVVLGEAWRRSELEFVAYGMPFCMALALQVVGLQRNRAGFRASQVLAQTAMALAGGMFAFVVLHAVLEFQLVGRFILILSLVYGIAFILGSRLLIWRLAEQQSKNILVYGSRAIHRTVVDTVKLAQLPIRVVGHMRLESLLPPDPESFEKLTKLDLHGHCLKSAVEEIIVEVTDALSGPERQALLACTGLGIGVVDLNYFFERDLERVYVPGLKESWFWEYDPAHVHPIYFFVKRAMDVAISLVGLLCFMPLAPFVVLLIKLPDGGPIFYSQIRLGLHSQPFRIFKFRTMRVNAEPTGAQWASETDDRITKYGRFLRLTRIDEIPQFLNILRGEMSLIGPRPERPELVDTIEKQVPFYRYRHLIKPGLTGWAQVNYPYGASVSDAQHKLSYDLYYMKYSTITRELHIILRTIVAMVRGAR